MKDLYIKALIGIMLMLVSGNAWGSTTNKETHKVFFSVNGTIQNTGGTEVAKGAAITFPTENPEEIYGKKFVGWCGSKYTNATTPPQYVASAKMEDHDIIYYAVFATTTNASMTKITDEKQIVNGTYAIISYDGEYYLPNEKSINTNPKVTSTTKTDNMININEDMTWNLSIDSYGKIHLASTTSTGSYLWAKTSVNDIRVATYISDATRDLYIKSTDNYGLVLYKKSESQYLSTNGTQKWRTYSSTSETNRAANLYLITYSNYCTTVPSTATITLNAACTDGENVYSTFSHPSAWVVPNNLTVSAVIVDGGKLTINDYTTGEVVPTNTGVMVSAVKWSEGETTKNFTIDLSNEAGTIKTNNLKPSGNGITKDGMASANTNCTFYRLTMHNGSQIGFWWGAENGAAFTLGANKAYLAVPNSAQVKAQCLWRSDEETGIVDVTDDDEIDETVNESRTVYDLSGRRLDKVSYFGGKKGFYIINGKKVIK